LENKTDEEENEKSDERLSDYTAEWKCKELEMPWLQGVKEEVKPTQRSETRDRLSTIDKSDSCDMKYSYKLEEDVK
jgi:hypothetical protein